MRLQAPFFNGISIEFNGISNEIQSVVYLGGEIQEIASKLLLTFWGGVINTTFALNVNDYVLLDSYMYTVYMYIRTHIYIYIIYTYVYTYMNKYTCMYNG